MTSAKSLIISLIDNMLHVEVSENMKKPSSLLEDQVQLKIILHRHLIMYYYTIRSV